MNQSDAPAFFEMLDTTYDLIGVGPAKIISPAAKAMFFTDLQMYPLHLIEQALAAHRVDPDRGRFTPKPADISSQIERRREIAWISADEAWSRVPKSEGAPGLLNQVTVQALAVAMPFLTQEKPDQTAARMAFKGCYDRLADRAKLQKTPPQYFVSPGGSHEEQMAIIDEGRRLGMLAAPASAPVERIEQESRTPGAKPNLKALLLSLNQKTMPAPEAADYDD